MSPLSADGRAPSRVLRWELMYKSPLRFRAAPRRLVGLVAILVAIVGTSVGEPQGIRAAGPQPTTLLVTQSKSTTNVSEEFTLTFQVLPDPGPGSVSLRLDGHDYGFIEQPLFPGGTATRSMSFADVGVHTIDVTYGGTPDFGPSLVTVVHTAVENRLAVGLTIASDTNPSATFQYVNFTVKLDPVPPDGQVLLLEGASHSSVWTNFDSSGTAVIRWPFALAGDFDMKACYSGSAAYQNSCSPILIQHVHLAQPTVVLTATPNSIRRDGQTTFAVHVDPPPGSGPTSLVVDGGAPLLRWDIPVDPVTGDGSVVWHGTDWGVIPPYLYPSAGTHQLVARYSYGDGSVTSTPSDLTLTLDPTTTTLQTTTSTTAGESAFHVRAAVSPVPPPGSVVVFTLEGLQPWPLGRLGTDSAGVAEGDLAIPLIPGGIYHVRAVFLDSLALASSEDVGSDFDISELLAPVVTAPTAALALGPRLGTTVPLTLAWTIQTKGSGPAVSTIEQSLDGGAWISVATSSLSAYTVQAVRGHSYKFRIQASAAGYVSAPTYSPQVRPSVVEETGPGVTFAGRWIRYASSGYGSGAVLASRSLGAAAVIRFRGRSIAWVTDLGPTRGWARIYVDGRLVRTVNLGARVNRVKAVAFAKTWSMAGSHTLKVVVAPRGRSSRVDIDAFVVLR